MGLILNMAKTGMHLRICCVLVIPFAVPANQPNPENVEFYLFICQRPKFLVSEAFTCQWGPEFEVGDYAVVGTYYQAWGKGFVLLGSLRHAYLQAELVVQIKFRMEP
jgi:hypothetical protein